MPFANGRNVRNIMSVSVRACVCVSVCFVCVCGFSFCYLNRFMVPVMANVIQVVCCADFFDGVHEQAHTHSHSHTHTLTHTHTHSHSHLRSHTHTHTHTHTHHLSPFGIAQIDTRKR